MIVPLKDTIIQYKRTLAEYASLYQSFSNGHTKGSIAAYQKLVREVLDMAAYLRMLESMYPLLVEHKPKCYKAIYYPIKRT